MGKQRKGLLEELRLGWGRVWDIEEGDEGARLPAVGAGGLPVEDAGASDRGCGMDRGAAAHGVNPKCGGASSDVDLKCASVVLDASPEAEAHAQLGMEQTGQPPAHEHEPVAVGVQGADESAALGMEGVEEEGGENSGGSGMGGGAGARTGTVRRSPADPSWGSGFRSASPWDDALHREPTPMATAYGPAGATSGGTVVPGTLPDEASRQFSQVCDAAGVRGFARGTSR